MEARAVAAWPASVLVWVLVCASYAAAIAMLGGIASLGPGSFAYAACAAAIVAGWPSRWRVAALLAVAAVVCWLDPSKGEISMLPIALAACVVVRWAGRFAAEVRGVEGRAAAVEAAAWIVGFWFGGFLVDGSSIVVIFVGVLWRHGRMLVALARGPMRWRPLAIALLAVAVVVGMFRRSFEAEPVPCRPEEPPPAAAGSATDPVWIATLGDSSSQPLFLPSDLGYAAGLETRLARGGTRHRYRVVNCSFSGASSKHIDGQLDRALVFRPRVVTVFIGDNDTLFRAGRPLPQIFDEYRTNLRALIARCRREGARPILITSLTGVGWVGEFHHVLRDTNLELGRELGVTVIDAARDVRDRWYFPLYFIWDFVHPNEIGHDHIAHMLEQEVRSDVDATLDAP